MIRRTPLLLLATVSAVALVGPAPAAATTDIGDPARFAVETDRIVDRTATPPLDLALTRWTREILPWFAAEGIVRTERAPTRVRYVDFHGSLATLLLGTADCRGGVVSISSRFANPVSSTYRSVDLVFTLAHELAHVQQNTLCDRAPTELVEISAQLMAFEVTAAMALDGNRWAGLALLRELRDLAVGVLRSDAERRLPGAQARLDDVVDAVYTTDERASAAQRSLYWSRNPTQRKEVLLRYAVGPYRKLAGALLGDLVVTGLATPTTHGRPWASRPVDGTLVVDDLAHFLDVAAELYA